MLSQTRFCGQMLQSVGQALLRRNAIASARPASASFGTIGTHPSKSPITDKPATPNTPDFPYPLAPRLLDRSVSYDEFHKSFRDYRAKRIAQTCERNMALEDLQALRTGLQLVDQTWTPFPVYLLSSKHEARSVTDPVDPKFTGVQTYWDVRGMAVIAHSRLWDLKLGADDVEVIKARCCAHLGIVGDEVRYHKIEAIKSPSFTWWCEFPAPSVLSKGREPFGNELFMRFEGFPDYTEAQLKEIRRDVTALAIVPLH